MVEDEIGVGLQEKIRDGFVKKTIDRSNKNYDLYSILPIYNKE